MVQGDSGTPRRIVVNGFGAFAGGIVRVHDEIVDQLTREPHTRAFVANRPRSSRAQPDAVVLSEQTGSRARDVVRDAVSAFPLERYDLRIDTAPAFRFFTRARGFVVVVHDLNFLRAEIHGISWKQKLYRHVLHRWTLRRADRIVVVSSSTLDEISGLVPGVAPKCVVLPLPVDHLAAFVPPEPATTELGPDDPVVVLSFGHARNKGVEHLLAAMADDPRLHLRVVCTAEQWDEHWADRAAARGVTARCVVVERPGDAALAREYLDADVICMLSAYEGYGLPAAEGLFLGRPVVTTDLAVLRATTRERAVYVDPAVPGSVLAGIREAVSRGDAFWQEGAAMFRSVTWERWVRSMTEGV